MVVAHDVRLVVKHTFLEFVQHEVSRVRALTDTALLESYGGEGCHAFKSPPQFLPCSTTSAMQAHPVDECAGAASPRGRPERCFGPALSTIPIFPVDECRGAAGPRRSAGAGAGDASPEATAALSRPASPPTNAPEPAPDVLEAETRSPAGPAGAAKPARSSGYRSTAAASEEWRTTVMLRNVPNNYTRDMLIELVNTLTSSYNLIYFPVDFTTGAGLGYAFVNMCSPEDALALWSSLDGFSRWALPSQKVCKVSWSHPHQGLTPHVDRYRNSPVMHPAVPDRWKPALFKDGERIPFPAPTKKLKMPLEIGGRNHRRTGSGGSKA